jgi:hypothetical protein
MTNYRLLIRLVACCALACWTFGLSRSPSYGQGRSLTKLQIDAIVKPSLSQCTAATSGAVRVQGQSQPARLDPNMIIPTSNAREFPMSRIEKTMHGMWRGQVIGSPLDSKYEKSKEANVDYFWMIDTRRKEGLIIALRNGNNSTDGLRLASANPPKLSYLICAHEGYIPAVEKGSEIHEFVKVSDSVDNAAEIMAKATGLKFPTGKANLADLWKVITASGYFKSLPAVAFAGGFFKPMRLESVKSPLGPSLLSMSWDSEYYGGGTTWIKFTPGVPMKGTEYTQFVGTSATVGDFLVASPGNGKLYKVEARSGGDYDLSFDSVTMGPLQ